MSADVTSILKPQPEFAGILREQETFSSGSDDTADRLNSWFDSLILQSGVGLSPTVIMMLTLLCALTLGGIMFVIQENFLTTAFAAVLGFLIPMIGLVIARTRRQTLMMKQLPPMLEELARAAKTGRSVEQCLKVVANDTPSPLGNELQLTSKRLDLGMNVRDAMAELPNRTGLMTLSLLCTSLSVHQQTGGDLVQVLERLSRTVRDRLAYLGRLRAATAASRGTAILMMAIPPAVLAFFILRSPKYLTDLTSSSWGRMSVLAAVVLEIVGVLWILRVLRDSEQT